MLSTGVVYEDQWMRLREEQDMCQAWFPRARFEHMIGEGLISDDSTLAAYALLLISER
jgi:8-oxo-dGDP phosphatase